jgi:hypothetical protein
MNRLKTWQAVALAVIAVVIAVGMAWRSLASNEKGAPIPMPYSGPPAVAGGGPQGTASPVAGGGTQSASPVPPSSFPGAPPAAGGATPQ